MVDGVSIQLTPTECRVLLALARSPSQVLLHDQLAQRVWSYPNASTAPSLSIHIRSLRSKLRGQAAEAPRIATVKGVGYSLIPT
jgi:DNA-binding response OmpR family regulator